MVKRKGKELESTTLCFNLDITLPRNAWRERNTFRSAIEHQLAMAIDGKVDLKFEEMHYNYKKSDSLTRSGE